MKRILLSIAVCVLFFNSFSQVNTNAAWTWVKGSKRVPSFPEYGATGNSAPGNLPGGRKDFVSWQDAAGMVWIFGGRGNAQAANAYLNDLWKYDPATNVWAFIRGSKSVNDIGNYGVKAVSSLNNQPGSRIGACSWTDALGNFYLFGGYGYATTGIPGRLNDLWKYDPVTNQWTWINGSNVIDITAVYGALAIADPANTPGARSSATTWFDGTGNAWIFGGRGFANAGLGYLSDLWKYNSATNEWTWIKGSNVIDQPGNIGAQGFDGRILRKVFSG